MSKKPTLREERDQAVVARESAREIARLLWHWCLWHEELTNHMLCATTLEDLEALRVGCLEEYEKWRRVRESGMRNAHPWIKEPLKEITDGADR